MTSAFFWLNSISLCPASFSSPRPNFLGREVKWVLGSISMNKASGGDGLSAELLQILKDDAVKCCTQYASRSGKLSNGHRTGKGLFSFQS